MTPTPKPPTITDDLPRVIRGGGRYDLVAARVRSAFRSRFAPAFRYIIGFRCAQRGVRMPVLKGLTPP